MADTQIHKSDIYVFDAAVPDVQTLIDAVTATAGTGARIILLKADSDGVLQLADTLAGESNLDAIHLFSHGSVGNLQLGSTFLNTSTLPGYSAALAQIGNALNADGDLLLYGCNVAQGELGQLFIHQVAGATGADVAASVDLTGGTGLGGGWQLEANVGLVGKPPVLLTDSAFHAVLSTTANGGLTSDDISTAAYLSRAAYDDKVTGTATTAVANIAAQGAGLSGWQYVSPTAFGVSSSLVDAKGYFNMGLGASQQALLAYNAATHTLAIAFRGTSGTVDFLNDVIGGAISFLPIYLEFETYLVSNVLSGAAGFGATRILATGHSLGGAMVELMMARNADTGALSFSGVTFGSPGSSDVGGIGGNAPGTDARLLNIGHVDLTTAVGTLATFSSQGDPVFRLAVNENIQGYDIRVDLPLFGNLLQDGLAQHDSWQYQNSARLIVDELNQNLRDGHGFDVRAFNYVIGTAPVGTSSSLTQLTGSPNADVVIGSFGRQIINGGDGNDILDGLTGDDDLYGHSGNDTLYGGMGPDNLYGGTDSDTYIVDDAGDRVFELAGEGLYDIVQSSITYTLGANVEDLSLLGSSSINGSGNTFANTIVGNSGNNSLYGSAGYDTIDGGIGVDRLFGEAGNDELRTSASGDFLDGGTENDKYVINVSVNVSSTTEISDNAGVDLLEINAVNADPLKTRFSLSGGSLVVEIHGMANQLLTTATIHNNGNIAAVETLRLNYGGLFTKTYDLQTKLEAAMGGIALSAPSFVADDYVGNISTTGFLDIGSFTTGRIEIANDRDWFQVNLIAGRSYQFDLKGAPTNSGDLADPYLTLRDVSGTVLRSDDNSGVGNDAQIAYTATSTGLYFIGAGSSNTLTGTGTYKVVTTQTSVTPLSTNSAPLVVGAGQALTAGTVLSASGLFHAIDSDGGAIVSYTINDATGSGYFQLGGVHQVEGSSFTVNATQYNSLQYVVGGAGSSDTFSVKASDGFLTGANQSITVVGLAAVAVPPPVLTAQNDLAVVVAGNQAVINVLANDDSHLIRITDLQYEPGYISIRPGTQDAIVITPPAWFTGSFTFSYTATDGSGHSASANVALTVTQPIPSNHAPTASNFQHTIANNQQDQTNLLYNSYDSDSNETNLLTLQGYSNPAHGTLAANGSTVTYTPNAGYVGNDSYAFVIQDPHGAQGNGTVSISVVQPLVAVDDVISTAVGQAAAFNVLQNDTYSASDQFFLLAPPSTESKPPHGSVSYTQAGLMVYTPDAGYSGVDSFTYRILYFASGTGLGSSSTGYVTLLVGSSGAQGGSGPDVLNGTNLNDGLFGNVGNDTLWGGAGDDILDGGPGFDIVSFSNAPVGISVTLRQPDVNGLGTINWADPFYWSNDGLGGRDSVRSIEGVYGSEFGDTITGGPGNNAIYGNGGNDAINAFGGDDTVYGGDGDDLIQSGNLVPTSRGNFFGGNGNDSIYGNYGADILDGGTGNDELYGIDGSDVLSGRDGNDRLRGTGILDGGNGDDFLFAGNTSGVGVIASKLMGGNGNDTLFGRSASDTLEGGDGNDSLAGGPGDDRMDGGTGFDTADFRGDSNGITVDLASEFAQTSDGFDTLVSIETVWGSWNAKDRILGSENAEAFYGDVGNDTLIGRGGDDSLDGGSGDDWIQGDSGVDHLAGGTGVDRFAYLSTADKGDLISDFVVGVGGDLLDISGILSSNSYVGSSPAFDGYLRLVASGSNTLVQIDADGNLANFNFETITTLQGVSPTSLVAANFSTTVDMAALIAAIPSTFRINVLTAIQKPGTNAPAIYEGDTGTTPLVIRFVREGNTINSLTAAVSLEIGDGLTAADFASGLPVNGNITFAAGQSTYDLALSVVGDTLVEADEKLSVSITSPTSANAPSASVWILTEENLIDGNGALVGTSGADVILSHGLDDLILADTGADNVVSGSGNDYIDAGDGNDSVDGGAGNDTLDGAAGTDTMIGGAGNDTYVVDTLADVVTELANEGTDTIQTHITYTLAALANVENLTLTGAAAINGTGNAANNLMVGNGAANNLSGGVGNDTLDGGAGNDTLLGGLGDDVYGVDAAGDVVTELANEGLDTIQTALSSYSLVPLANVENLSFTGSGNFTGTGHAGANVLTGSSGSDTLTGGLGNDTINGGLGYDTAVFSGVKAGYTVTRGVGSVTVTGADGIDVLTGIEKLQFSDGNTFLSGGADFNGDGTGDLLWRNTGSGSNAIWRGANPITQQAIAALNDLNWKILGTSDFNADGASDILWRNTSTGANTIWRGGDSAQTQSVATLADLNYKIVGVGDFNGNGAADLLWRNTATGANVIWDSANSATVQNVITVADPAWKVAGIGDFNGDGVSDILWRNASTGANAIWSSANPTTQQAIIAVADQAWKVAGIGDFNSDGVSDILWRNAGTGSNAIWKGANHATQQTIIAIADQNWQVSGTNDYNGDGASDLLWRNLSTGADAIWNSASHLTQQPIPTIADQTWTIQAQTNTWSDVAPAAPVDRDFDFNGDGKSDVMWRNTATGADAIWLSANNATQQAVLTVADQTWKMAGFADFNGDGKDDILWRNSVSGANAIWNAGNNATQLPILDIADVNWKIAGLGDFNGDGKDDILWRNTATGADAIWNAANPATQLAVLNIADQTWQVAGIGDFNGDGKDDILWRNFASGANAIWNSGNVGTQAAILNIADQTWQVAGVADFNGDGKDDVLWRNTASGANAIWNAGNVATQLPILSVADLAWKVAGVGDYNGDGKADVAWRNAATGADAIWNGGNSATQLTLIGVADLNWTLPEQSNTWVNAAGGYVV